MTPRPQSQTSPPWSGPMVSLFSFPCKGMKNLKGFLRILIISLNYIVYAIQWEVCLHHGIYNGLSCLYLSIYLCYGIACEGGELMYDSSIQYPFSYPLSLRVIFEEGVGGEDIALLSSHLHHFSDPSHELSVFHLPVLDNQEIKGWNHDVRHVHGMALKP